MYQQTFKDIFAQYWVIYRGQATAIPQFGDREHRIAVLNAVNGVKKWERVDGQLWRELRSTLQAQSDGEKTISEGKILYDCPENMRKPPGRVFVYSNNEHSELFVVDPKNLARLNELSSAVTFIGSANTGYKMQISDRVSKEMDGRNVDYVYDKAAALPPLETNPDNYKVEMSDPRFLVWHMVKLRAASTNNGFLFRLAESEASISLMDMKIENENGTWDNPDVMEFNSRFGVPNTTERML